MEFPALFAEALRTKRQYGIGLMRQLRQLIALRWSGHRLDAWCYYFYQVFLDRYPMEQKRRFIGWRGELSLDQRLNAGANRSVANDKLLFDQRMRDIGAPVPAIHAAYAPENSGASEGSSLTTPTDVENYLAETDDFPMFVKPLRGAHGWNAAAIRRRIENDATLELASGERRTIADFVAELQRDTRHAYLFQELLKTHPAIAARCGDRLTSVRAIVLTANAEPELLSVVWRIPTGANMTDNFSVGTTGNLCAAVDLDSGKIGNVFQGVGWRNLRRDDHPDTGETLTGFTLPDWPRTRDLCLQCARHLPGLRLQHWDVALTHRGPVLLELNVQGGLRTHQVVAEGPGRLARLADLGD
ncbi:MAG: hypothetical protein KJO13_06200 [Gammaproteobacteria bacterium]|nr:hypothetical protein [Gammaproteobacteria bacterium]